MKNLSHLDPLRQKTPRVKQVFGSYGDDTCGVFVVASPDDMQGLRVVASSGGGWDHVSVSRQDRIPSWTEMEYVKRLFFQPHEIAMQLHLPETEHVNCHQHCLHIWRSHTQEIPRPPVWMVGPKP